MQFNKFVLHLEELYRYYSPDTSRLPTGDQMLSGLLFPPSNLTMDEEQYVVEQLIENIKPTIMQYPRWNILVESKIINFCKSLENLTPEYKILAIKTITTFFSTKEKNMQVQWDNYRNSVFPTYVAFINN
jgi:hypothetical protein